METKESSSAILAMLSAEREALRAAVARIPESRRAESPAPGCWSVVQVLEHLTRVERGIARLLAVRGREQPGPLPAGVRPDDVRLTPGRIARLRNRAERIEAPERVRPAGTSDPAGAWRALEDERAALVAAFAAAESASLDGIVHEHPALGPLVLRDWVAFVGHHEARHAQQVAEIAEQLGIA